MLQTLSGNPRHIFPIGAPRGLLLPLSCFLIKAHEHRRVGILRTDHFFQWRAHKQKDMHRHIDTQPQTVSHTHTHTHPHRHSRTNQDLLDFLRGLSVLSKGSGTTHRSGSNEASARFASPQSPLKVSWTTQVKPTKAQDMCTTKRGLKSPSAR